ncbi:MAG: DUF1571 domain-containing protein [Phycisphaerae bacterium]|nr:DUF1571 domain-containing protein [Phycisphaerae bacterium]
MKTHVANSNNRKTPAAQRIAAVCILSTLLLTPMFANAQEPTTVTATPEEQQKAIQLAGQDHAALLNFLIDRYDRNVRDYTGTFLKQEKIDGKLTPNQKIAFKFRQQPFSVFMEWLENPVGADKILYVEGQNDGKMLAHPTGLISWVKSVKIDPEGRQATKSSLYPVTRFGFRSNLVQTLEVYRDAAEKDHAQIAFTGPETVAGRQVLTFERTLPHGQYENPRLTVRLDLEYLLPTEIIATDQNGDLISHYTYTDLNFNTNLTDQDFAGLN